MKQKDVVNEAGITFKEYVHFPDSLRGFFRLWIASWRKRLVSI